MAEEAEGAEGLKASVYNIRAFTRAAYHQLPLALAAAVVEVVEVVAYQRLWCGFSIVFDGTAWRQISGVYRLVGKR